MAPLQGVTLEVLAERLEGVRQDVAELRTQRREDHHRLRNVEAAVTQMIDAQKDARAGELRQYRRLGLRVQYGGFAMALAMVVLTLVTIFIHHG